MADKREFGIGLIGLGIGQQHLLGYQRQNLRVAAICDKDTTRLNEIGNTFGVDKRYTRIADLIADTDVDVVDMAVQPWIRSPIVKAAAEAGKHILCQKPLCRTYTNLTNLLKCIEIYTNLTEVFDCCHTSCFNVHCLQTRSYTDSTGV